MNIDGTKPIQPNAGAPQARSPISSTEHKGLELAGEVVRTTIPKCIAEVDRRRGEQMEKYFPVLSKRRKIFKDSIKKSRAAFSRNGRPLIPKKHYERLKQLDNENLARGFFETYASRREKNMMYDLLNKDTGYKTARGLEDYSDCYKAVTGRSIEDKINSLQGPIRVFDEGCGRGKALGDIKKQFGNKVHTIGLTSKHLVDQVDQGVDEVHDTFAEEWLPDKPLDLILSVCGGTYYSQDEVKWQMMLKNAHSLSENGEAMFVLYLDKDLKGYQNQDLTGQKQSILGQIKNLFNEQGFEMEWKSFPSDRFKSIELPHGHKTDVIMVRRKK